MKSSLYVNRPLLNVEDLRTWAKSQGFTSTLEPDDLHVTICFSKEPFDWSDIKPKRDRPFAGARDDGRSIQQFGDAVVLLFDAPEFAQRHDELCDAGASFDFDRYHPHVTITYDGAPDDLDAVQPYDGELQFGPEEFSEIVDDWADDIDEDTLKRMLKASPDGSDVHINQPLGKKPKKRKKDKAMYTRKGGNNEPGHPFRGNQYGGGGGGGGSEGGEDDIVHIPHSNDASQLIPLNRTKATARMSALSDKMKGATGSKLKELRSEHDALSALMDRADRFGVKKREHIGAKVLKVDSDLGVVFGWAMVCDVEGQPYFDTQGDYIPQDVMLKAATSFMSDLRVGKEMHVGEQKGSIVFAWPMTSEIAKAMGVDASMTGMMIGFKPDDKAILKKYQDGDYTGFSIGGMAKRIPVED